MKSALFSHCGIWKQLLVWQKTGEGLWWNLRLFVGNFENWFQKFPRNFESFRIWYFGKFSFGLWELLKNTRKPLKRTEDVALRIGIWKTLENHRKSMIFPLITCKVSCILYFPNLAHLPPWTNEIFPEKLTKPKKFIKVHRCKNASGKINSRIAIITKPSGLNASDDLDVFAWLKYKFKFNDKWKWKMFFNFLFFFHQLQFSH